MCSGQVVLMIYLSRNDLHELSLKLLYHYYKTNELPFCPLDIIDFAQHYMNLTVRYEDLTCKNRTVLGCIAYENTVLVLDPNDPNTHIPISARTVFLNKSLKKRDQKGRRNFTLAHECAHNAVHSIYPKAWTEFQCREPGREYSLRELITGDDWCEWQANTLASELLMPTHLIYGLLKQEGYREKVKVYPKDRLLFDERRLIRNMTDFLGVSKSALLIRLKQLNLLDYRNWDEYLEEEEFDSLLGGY